MRLKKLILMSAVGFAVASCSTPKNITYFQDVADKDIIEVATPTQIKLQPKDKINILVNSQDPRLTNLFNLPIVAQTLGQDIGVSQQARGISGYTIDENGFIDFPVLGPIELAGLTRDEAAKKIKKKLKDEDQLKDAVVTVEYMNLGVSVMGEVKTPGRYPIDREDMTILDAISRAGDLTINGMRENVKVIREADGKKEVFYVNLNSASDVYGSPVYYLRQNDIIYIEPNETQKRASTVNGNNVRSTSFWISLASLLTSVCVLIFK